MIRPFMCIIAMIQRVAGDPVREDDGIGQMRGELLGIGGDAGVDGFDGCEE